MGQGARVKINDIRRDLTSEKVETRGHALHMLLVCMHRQPELQQAAREIFRHAVEHETAEWPVNTALMGLEMLEGPDATRPHWRRLLTQPDAVAAGRAAMSVYHPSHLPMMLELIAQRPEFTFRRGAVYALGRMKDASVLPLLQRLGEDEEMQPQVVQAMSDLGDPAAIPWLQILVPSDRHLPELDERGATWTLGDIAAQAIRSIESRSGVRATPVPATAAAQQGSVVTPPPLPITWANPVPQAAWRPWSLLHPSLIPLIAAGLELALLFFLFATYIFMVGDQKPTFTVNDRLIDAIALPLPVIGLVSALTLIVAGLAPRLWHKAVTLIGGLICTYFAFAFGFDFLTR